jgi:hypothetical protein
MWFDELAKLSFSIQFYGLDKFKCNFNISINIIISKQSRMLNIPHKKIGKYLLFSSKKLAQLKYSSVFLGLHS